MRPAPADQERNSNIVTARFSSACSTDDCVSRADPTVESRTMTAFAECHDARLNEVLRRAALQGKASRDPTQSARAVRATGDIVSPFLIRGRMITRCRRAQSPPVFCSIEKPTAWVGKRDPPPAKARRRHRRRRSAPRLDRRMRSDSTKYPARRSVDWWPRQCARSGQMARDAFRLRLRSIKSRFVLALSSSGDAGIAPAQPIAAAGDWRAVLPPFVGATSISTALGDQQLLAR